jgi:aminoglycoside phosphotransferase (APT) family kinase protein
VYGHTLGAFHGDRTGTWSHAGCQLALLHSRVEECPDPLGWLDTPGRELDLAERLDELLRTGGIDCESARQLASWIEELRPAVAAPVTARFIHNDVHEMNVMCSEAGSLLALLDWGDAGWGDPALDFAYVPLPVLRVAMDAYEEAAPGLLGDSAESRVLWDHLAYALEALPSDRCPLDELCRFLRSGDTRQL